MFAAYISEFRKHDMCGNYIGVGPEFNLFFKNAQPHAKTRDVMLENLTDKILIFSSEKFKSY